VTSDQEFGIGQVGLGSITVAHRQGYRLYGQPVVAGYDPNPQAWARFAEEEPGATVHETLEACLRILESDLDLATPHHRATRLPVVQRVADAGIPMFIQKPLAYRYADALEMVAAVERNGVTAMVNQNMCFTPGSLRLIDALMKDAAVGRTSCGEIQRRPAPRPRRYRGHGGCTRELARTVAERRAHSLTSALNRQWAWSHSWSEMESSGVAVDP
jgi:predicted dehydrogenase